MYEKGKHARDYFTARGELRHIKKLKFWPMSEVLGDKYRLPEDEVGGWGEGWGGGRRGPGGMRSACDSVQAGPGAATWMCLGGTLGGRRPMPEVLGDRCRLPGDEVGGDTVCCCACVVGGRVCGGGGGLRRMRSACDSMQGRLRAAIRG